MMPLRVHAEIARHIAAPVSRRFALDSLLIWARALELDLPPVETAEDCRELDIPIAIDPVWRVPLCSFSLGDLSEHELQWINQRPIVEPAQRLGLRGAMNITGGHDKGWRVPLDTAHALDGLTWFCVGDRDGIANLLSRVHYVGRKRSTGLGRVVRWTVESCEPWEGFPCVRDGQPLRPLPREWPGLVDPPLGYACIRPPYWHTGSQELCAVPAAA